MPSAVIGSLRVNLGIDTAAFDAGINDFAGGMKRVGKKLQKVGVGLSAAVTLPLIGFATKSVEAFKQSEDALAQVEAAIKSTGGAAGLTSDQLAEMAAGLQSVSTFDDDDILQNVSAQLLKFGSISGDVFAKAQQAIVDYSARTGTDLAAATQLIGKSLDSPVKALGALRKAGVTFTTEQQTLIKTLMEGGRQAEAQGVILDVLAGKFGGAAAAMAETTSGAQAQAWNALGDAMEAVGAVVARVIPPIAGAVQRAAEWFSSLNPRVQEFIVIGGGIAAALGPALIALGFMATGIAAIGLPLAGVVAGIAGLTAVVVAFWPEINTAAKALDAFLVSIGDAAKEKIVAFGQAFVVLKDTALAAIQALVTGVQTWIEGKLNAVWDGVAAKIDWVTGKFQGMYQAVVGGSYIPDMVTGVEDWMGRLGTSFGNSIAGLIDGTMSWRDALSSLLKELSSLAMSSGIGALGGIGGGAGGFFGSLVQGLLGGGLPGLSAAAPLSQSVNLGAGNDNGGGGMTLRVVPSPYFDVRVDERSGRQAEMRLDRYDQTATARNTGRMTEMQARSG